MAGGRVAVAEGGKEATYTGKGSTCIFDKIYVTCIESPVLTFDGDGDAFVSDISFSETRIIGC